MKVPVPHPVRVPNLVVIMYNEIILFCGFFVLFSQEDFFKIITEVCHWFLNCQNKDVKNHQT